MELYHWTKKECLESIFKRGLISNGFGIIYLTPNPKNKFGDTLLKVETGELKLTAFEDCKDWEILCWGNIPPKDIEKVNIA